MIREAQIEHVPFESLRPGHVLLDVARLYAVVVTAPLQISPDLAIVGIRAWTTNGELITTGSTSLTALDSPDAVRRVYVPRHRRPWRPPRPRPWPWEVQHDPGDRLDGIAPHIDRNRPEQ